MQNAIEVKNVTKIYRLYDKPADRLKESLSIIGTNGSGKSTILKIITGVLTPTEGNVSVDGRISALLELGAGFNMEYTGIENIYMNGTMMGYSKADMDAKLKEILDFADIGDFVYQPVKSYSSGMFVRLAFAVAINVDPEILIVDEALSVGDIFFQSKCYRRMDELRKSGTTILMVTHDMSSVLKYCDRTVLLNDGVKVAEGKPGEMVDLYKKILAGQYGQLEDMQDNNSQAFGINNGKASENGGNTANAASLSEAGNEHKDAVIKHAGALMRDSMTVNPDVNEYGNKKAEIYDFGVLDKNGRLTNLVLKGESFTIKEKIRFFDHIEAPIFTYTFRDKKGNDLTGTTTLFENADVKSVENGDEYEVSFTQNMDLQGGEYLLSMSCTGFEQGEHVVYHRLYDILNFTVISNKNTVGVYDMNSKVTVRKS